MKTYAILHRTRLCGHTDADSIVGKLFRTVRDAYDHVERVAGNYYESEKRAGVNLTSWKLVHESDAPIDPENLVGNEMFLVFGEDSLYDHDVVESYEIFELEG